MNNLERKLGWIPDLPDNRDYSFTTIKNKNNLLNKNKAFSSPAEYLLNISTFSPIEDQGNLGSCTANAAAGIVEYMERKASSRHVDVSRIFLYKVTRNLMRVTGDTGAYLRDTIRALRLFGSPPEPFYPYNIANFDKEPTAYHYALAANYKSINYFRVDLPTLGVTDILASCKDKLVRGYPLMFGFTCFESLYSPAADAGNIPFPNANEAVIGGHAVTMVGYSDIKGAFRIRNSWGKGWGEQGYGWLPYKYVLEGLVEDIWGIIRQEWVDSGVFE